MQPGAATNRWATKGWLCLCLLAACAGTRYEPGKLSDEQVAKCRALEVAYRSNAPDYPVLRDQAVADPVVAAWVVRMFVRDLFAVREGRPLGEDREFLRAAARLEDPVEVRALAEVRALGAIAVPTLLGDLLLHDQPQPRELGIELLALVGAPAIAPLQDVVRTGEPKQRRAAARALGRIGVEGQVLATLRELTGDEDYTVRADALRSLRGGGEAARGLLVERLQRDDDPFVRCVAAQTLGEFPATATANALIDYLERCKRDKDWRGEQAAQASLQKLAGTRGPRTPEAWRAFAPELDARTPPSATNSR